MITILLKNVEYQHGLTEFYGVGDNYRKNLYRIGHQVTYTYIKRKQTAVKKCFLRENKFHFSGTVKWYGRAELMQSDHRPIMAIIDVEVHKGISKHQKMY